MNTYKLLLASMALIVLACLSTADGQYRNVITYSSGTSVYGSDPSVVSHYGWYAPIPQGQIIHLPKYFIGTVLSVRDTNSMYINLTDPVIPEIDGPMLTLLPRPVVVGDLAYFKDKQLNFSLLGHDILGRPVCNAYFEGISIDDYLKAKERYVYSRGYYIGSDWYFETSDTFGWPIVP